MDWIWKTRDRSVFQKAAETTYGMDQIVVFALAHVGSWR